MLRENYKILEDSLEKGYSIVFLVKKDADVDSIDFKNIEKDMLKIFNKSKIRVME